MKGRHDQRLEKLEAGIELPRTFENFQEDPVIKKMSCVFAESVEDLYHEYLNKTPRNLSEIYKKVYD